MSEIVIRAESISKQYRLGVTNHGQLRKDLQSWWARARGKEDPNAGISEAGIRETQKSGDRFWALRDISFEICRGERVGIIGQNGAGKSTLLKIFSRVTAPTEGLVKVRGTIASLLEVGTGFNPELTGRENVFLNGAILGMNKAEVRKKFDEIVDFAEIARFIDTPVKRYSSGMYVRLAFAVAAHLESEILLVDEVLAVGDAGFQKKCLGKMDDISRSQGRTVLFVSHNMPSIINLCERTILLQNGINKMDGKTRDVVQSYLMTNKSKDGEIVWETPKDAPGNEEVKLHAVRLFQTGREEPTSDIDISRDLFIHIEYWNFRDGLRIYPGIWLRDQTGSYVLSSAHHKSISLTSDPWADRPHPVGLFQSVCCIPGNFLNDTTYSVTAIVGKNMADTIVLKDYILSFTVHDTGEMRKEFTGEWIGSVRPKLSWNTELVQEDTSKNAAFTRR
jgi:lipopolysaccharide transport system ATP-binding protein